MKDDHPWGRTGDLSRLRALASSFGYADGDLGHLEQAVTHKSFVNESTESLLDNERLEFLGDAVVDLLVAETLMSTHPRAPEGALSRVRAGLVCARSLAEISKELGLGDVLRLGRGEELSGGRLKESLLADTYEAIVGAVYLDHGLESARRVVIEHFGKRFEALELPAAERDHKTTLQEHTQRQSHETPVYRVETESGPDHDKQFTVSVSVGNQVLATGVGRSKKHAERAAAGLALDALRRTQKD